MSFHFKNRLIIFMLAFAALISALVTAQSDDNHGAKVREAAAQSVNAGKVFDATMETSDKAIPRDPLAHSKAIAVFPQVIEAAFLIGGEGGRGVVSQRTSTGWSDPVFRAGADSVGQQIGASATDIVLLFMNDDAAGSLLKNRF